MYPEFDDLLDRRSDLHAQLEAAAPFVRNAPPSILNGIIGNLASVSTQPQAAQQTNGITTGTLAELVYWRGQSVADTMIIAATIVPVQLPQRQPTALRPFANIQFGTQGFQTAVEVDICLGQQLTLSGSSILVTVGLELIPNSPNAAVNMQIAGMLSFGSVQKSNSATRTRYVDNTSIPAEANGIVIPPFSKNVWWLPNDIVTAAGVTTLTFHDSQTNVTHSAVIPANTLLTSPIQLSDDDVTVDVGSSQAGKSGRLVFGICF